MILLCFTSQLTEPYKYAKCTDIRILELKRLQGTNCMRKRSMMGGGGTWESLGGHHFTQLDKQSNTRLSLHAPLIVRNTLLSLYPLPFTDAAVSHSFVLLKDVLSISFGHSPSPFFSCN